MRKSPEMLPAAETYALAGRHFLFYSGGDWTAGTGPVQPQAPLRSMACASDRS